MEILDSAPIKQSLRRVPISTTQIGEAEFQKMLEHGVIKPSDSPWASPIVLVEKKDGMRSFCEDFCKVSVVSKKDAYCSLPLAQLPRVGRQSQCIQAQVNYILLSQLM